MNPRARLLRDALASGGIRARRRGRRRFSLAPITLGLALFVGLGWLTELLPRVWEVTLPGGLAQAAGLRGWPGLLWASAAGAHRNRAILAGGIAAAALVGLALARSSTAFRWGFRLLALLAVLLDFGLVFLTMRVALAAAGDFAVPGWGPYNPR
jgi:hypothetical protein